MIVRIALLGSALLMSGCDKIGIAPASIEGTYVGGSDTEAVILRLVEGEDGAVRGNLGFAQLNYEKGKIDVASRTISGRDEGQLVFLTVHGDSYNTLDAPVNAERFGGDLVLRAPGATTSVKLSRSNQAEYDKHLNVLAANLTANDVGLLPEE